MASARTLLLAILLCLPLSLRGQSQAPHPAGSAPPQTSPVQGSHPPTLDDTLDAGDDEAGEPAFDLVT